MAGHRLCVILNLEAPQPMSTTMLTDRGSMPVSLTCLTAVLMFRRLVADNFCSIANLCSTADALLPRKLPRLGACVGAGHWNLRLATERLQPTK